MAAKSVNVREYHETDDAALMHLMRRFTATAPAFPHGLIAIAEHGGKLVGYAVLYAKPLAAPEGAQAPPPAAYVLPDYRGRGITARLIWKLVDILKDAAFQL